MMLILGALGVLCLIGLVLMCKVRTLEKQHIM
jgi:hypothetical protein